MKPELRHRIITALHPSRMEPYLSKSGGNENTALQLYKWHTALTAATQEMLGITEVILRNAMDAQLQVWNRKQADGGGSWLLTPPAPPLRALCSGKRVSALNRATKEADARPVSHPRCGEPVGHDDVLAQVMFGMWKDLLPNHHPDASPSVPANINRQWMWTECLSAAFPHAGDPDGRATYLRVVHTHQLRNRVSHMEPLLNVDIREQLKEAFALIRSIDPAVESWVSSFNRVPRLLSSRP